MEGEVSELIGAERSERRPDEQKLLAHIFPDDQSVIRYAGMLCIEQLDEWLVGRRYLSGGSNSLVLMGRDDHIDKRRCASSNRPERPTSSPTR